jgi:hypothetical protein
MFGPLRNAVMQYSARFSPAQWNVADQRFAPVTFRDSRCAEAKSGGFVRCPVLRQVDCWRRVCLDARLRLV